MLTNYRETDTHDVEHPVQGLRSRGSMVTAWLGAEETESTGKFVKRLFEDGGVKGVGGFSLVAGKLRKKGEDGLEPFAIISNRSDAPDEVPWIAGERGQVYGLSNTSFHDPETWPKVKMGKEKTLEAVQHAVEAGFGEDELIEILYDVLDTDTLPPQEEGEDFEQYIPQLRKSIFIPTVGSSKPQNGPKADQIAAARPLQNGVADIAEAGRPDPETNTFMSGIYGTQRQTIILVDWEGKVTFRERALYDPEGRPIQRGKADIKFEFNVEGWNGEANGNTVHSRAEL